MYQLDACLFTTTDTTDGILHDKQSQIIHGTETNHIKTQQHNLSNCSIEQS